LAEPDNVDQENVENYSKTQHSQPPSAYSSGIGSGYSSIRSQSGQSYNRYSSNNMTNMTTPMQNTDNYQEENQNGPQAQTTMTNVDDIRKRLAKIKAQAF